MSVIDINEPTKSFSDYKPEELNVNEKMYFTFSCGAKIKTIKINIINITQYKYYMSNRELYESDFYVSFSTKINGKEIKKKVSFYTPDFYSIFSPCNYLPLSLLGSLPQESLVIYFQNEKKSNNFAKDLMFSC